MLAHEQVKAVDIVRPLPIEGAPQHKVIALPLKADGARSAAMQPPPRLGADTGEVLADLGLDRAEIDRLHALGAIG